MTPADAFTAAAVYEVLARRDLLSARVADEPDATLIEAAENVYRDAKRKSDVAYAAWKAAEAVAKKEEP